MTYEQMPVKNDIYGSHRIDAVVYSQGPECAGTLFLEIFFL